MGKGGFLFFFEKAIIFNFLTFLKKKKGFLDFLFFNFKGEKFIKLNFLYVSFFLSKPSNFSIFPGKKKKKPRKPIFLLFLGQLPKNFQKDLIFPFPFFPFSFGPNYFHLDKKQRGKKGPRGLYIKKTQKNPPKQLFSWRKTSPPKTGFIVFFSWFFWPHKKKKKRGFFPF